jgi:hypothetical protein
MKEAYGADYGAKDEKAEGQAQQRKGAAGQGESRRSRRGPGTLRPNRT